MLSEHWDVISGCVLRAVYNYGHVSFQQLVCTCTAGYQVGWPNSVHSILIGKPAPAKFGQFFLFVFGFVFFFFSISDWIKTLQAADPVWGSMWHCNPLLWGRWGSKTFLFWQSARSVQSFCVPSCWIGCHSCPCPQMVLPTYPTYWV